MGEAKWHLGMRIIQKEKYIIMLYQDQYVKNIIARFEKSFKHPFKGKQSPLPTTFIASKKDCPITEEQIKETKLRFGNLNFRSVIGALLYVSCHNLLVNNNIKIQKIPLFSSVILHGMTA